MLHVCPRGDSYEWVLAFQAQKHVFSWIKSKNKYKMQEYFCENWPVIRSYLCMISDHTNGSNVSKYF